MSDTKTKLPQEMKDARQWVVWKKKAEPHSAITGLRRAWNRNPATFEQAVSFCHENAGFNLGFLFVEGDGFIGIDIDGCRDAEANRIEAWGNRVVDFVGSYAEVSQSGTGVKIIAKCNAGSQYRAKVRTVDVEEWNTVNHADHHKKAEIDIFLSKYFAITSDVLEGYRALNEVELPLLESFLDKTFPQPEIDGQNVYNHAEPQSPGTPVLAAKDHVAIFRREHSIDDVITKHGWTCDGQMRYWRPGKGAGESISAEIKIKSDGVERITFFTTQCAPFEQNKGKNAATYCSWQCHVFLNHHKDFGAAKRQFFKDYPHHDPSMPKPSDFEIAEGRGAKAGAAVPLRHDSGRTDNASATRFIDAYANDLRYVVEWKKWLAWRNGKWCIKTGEHRAFKLARKFAKDMWGDVFDTINGLDKEEERKIITFARQANDNRRIESMLSLARHDERISVSHEDLDSHPFLFNLRNGTFDLKEGEFRDHRREDLITQMAGASYNPKAICPQFEDTLRLIFNLSLIHI